jgi:hypothetical protein
MQGNRRRQALCRPESVARGVLAITLSSYPRWRPMKELKAEFRYGGVVHQAIRELIAVGLMEREGSAVRPTQAAAHFDALMLP